MKSIVCPHCGNTDEFFIKRNYIGVRCFIDNQGTIIEDNLDEAYFENGKVVYCTVCGKQAMRTSTLDKLKIGLDTWESKELIEGV